jgi:hypothetical protein
MLKDEIKKKKSITNKRVQKKKKRKLKNKEQIKKKNKLEDG